MVVNLNPAISSNRAVVPMKKSNSKGVNSNPSAISFEGEGGGIKPKSSFLGRAARNIALFFAGASTLIACHKDPVVTPDPIKPPVDTTHVVVNPPVTNEKAVMPYLNTYVYNANGVDTVAYPAKNIASYETNVTPLPPSTEKPYKETYTFNKGLSSGEDTIVIDRIKNDTLLNGRFKFFVEKDPASGAKNLASQNWGIVKGKLEHVTDSKYRKTANSLINDAKLVASSGSAIPLEYIPDGKRNVDIKNGTKLIAKLTNIVTKLK